MNSNIETLKDLLNQAAQICEENIDKAHNIDLHSLIEVLDEYIEELEAIGDFETYDDDNETDLSSVNIIYLNKSKFNFED